MPASAGTSTCVGSHAIAFAFAAVGRAMELLLKPDKPTVALAQPAQADAEAD